MSFVCRGVKAAVDVSYFRSDFLWRDRSAAAATIGLHASQNHSKTVFEERYKQLVAANIIHL